MSKIQHWKGFLVPKAHRVIEFLAAQGIAMAARLFYGFLCVRLLPIPEYAKFAVVYGALGTLAILMDLAFTGSLIPLVGERTGDPQLIADYVASIRQLVHRLYLLMGPVTAVFYPLLVRNQHWSWPVVAGMVTILLAASWFNRVSAAYGAVLIVHRDRSVWYRAQIIAGLSALALLGVVWAIHGLNAFSAILISVVCNIYIASAYFLRARSVLGVAGRPSKEKRKEIIHLGLPIMPTGIFYAFQGQISLLLITIFGHTAAVASVGALGRLSQIFALIGYMNPLLIEPYFAKLPSEKLKRNYLGLMVVAGIFSVFLTALARCFPQAFLWILGHKYSGLRFEVLLTIAGGAIGYFGGIMWTVHWTRKFVYWWNGVMTIALTLAVQALFIWKVDLSTVRAVLILNLATTGVALLVNVLTGIYGFIRGPRKAAGLPVAALGDEYA
jgi:O-antigen/teichoic acid export membrane protein